MHSDLPDNWNTLKTSPFLTPKQIFYALYARTEDKEDDCRIKNFNADAIELCGHTIDEGKRTQQTSNLSIINMDFGTSQTDIAMFLELPTHANQYQYHLHLVQKIGQNYKTATNIEYTANTNSLLSIDNNSLPDTIPDSVINKAQELSSYILAEQRKSILLVLEKQREFLDKILSNKEEKESTDDNKLKQIDLVIKKFFTRYQTLIEDKKVEMRLENWTNTQEGKKFEISADEAPIAAKYTEQNLKCLDNDMHSFTENLMAFNHYVSETKKAKSQTVINKKQIIQLLDLVKKLHSSHCAEYALYSVSSFPCQLIRITLTFISELQEKISSFMLTNTEAQIPQNTKSHNTNFFPPPIAQHPKIGNITPISSSGINYSQQPPLLTPPPSPQLAASSPMIIDNTM